MLDVLGTRSLLSHGRRTSLCLFSLRLASSFDGDQRTKLQRERDREKRVSRCPTIDVPRRVVLAAREEKGKKQMTEEDDDGKDGEKGVEREKSARARRNALFLLFLFFFPGYDEKTVSPIVDRYTARNNRDNEKATQSKSSFFSSSLSFYLVLSLLF